MNPNPQPIPIPRRPAHRSGRVRFRTVLIVALAGLALLLGVVVYIARQRPELPMSIYLDDRINGVAIIRLDTPDAGLMPLLERWGQVQLSSKEIARLRQTIDTLVYPRLPVLLRGGEDDIYDTRALLVAHVRRLAPVLERALEPMLGRHDVEPERRVEGVGVYALPSAGFVASTGRAITLTNDPDWAAEAVVAQKGAVAPQRGRGADAQAADPTGDFARRCAELDSPHELCALARLTSARRRAIVRMVRKTLTASASPTVARELSFATNGLLDGVETVEAELDLRDRSRAAMKLRFEVGDKQAASAFVERLTRLRALSARGASAAPIAIDRPYIGDDGRAEITLTSDNYPALLALL